MLKLLNMKKQLSQVLKVLDYLQKYFMILKNYKKILINNIK